MHDVHDGVGLRHVAEGTGLESLFLAVDGRHVAVTDDRSADLPLSVVTELAVADLESLADPDGAYTKPVFVRLLSELYCIHPAYPRRAWSSNPAYVVRHDCMTRG